MVKVPVFGIGESSMLTAAAASRQFGVLTLGPEVVPRKWRQIRAMSIGDRCVAVEPTGTGVLHALKQDVDIEPYLRAARLAISKNARTLVLGCAGMVAVWERLSDMLEVPVVEPIVATCLLAASFLAGRGSLAPLYHRRKGASTDR